ncbi:hypothetical protein D3C76_1047140 [compost metagenome]
MADHAAATADIAFSYRAADRRMHGFGHMLDLDVKAVDVIEQAIEGLQHHRHVPVEPPVVRLLLTVEHDQGIAHHAQAVGVGEGDRAGQQTRFANPLKARGIAVAIEHMDPGKTRLLAGGTGTGFDHGDAGDDIAALGGATAYIAMTDPHARYVGDRVEGTGLQLAKLDVEIAGTWFHGGSHLQGNDKKVIVRARNLWERACSRMRCIRQG